MSSLRLALQPQPSTSDRVVALWIPTSDPTDWLRESARATAAGLTDLSLYPVVLAGVDHGAILVSPQGISWTPSPRTTPLVAITATVLAFASSRLNTSLAVGEAEQLFPAFASFYHPTLGLIAFTKDSRISPANLLALSPEPTQWNLAKPAPSPALNLKGIRVDLPEEFDSEQINPEGIGSKADQKIDPKSSTLGKLGKGLGLGLTGIAAGPLLAFLKMRPSGTHSQPNSLDKLEDWASKNWKDLTDARQRELDKLMDLMDSDPEAGLKYAIPLTGDDARRGNAAPGWQLGARSTTLGGTRGGQAVDGWDLNHETQLRLERQYRTIAEDAHADGNYERAAYIYGELLGDWNNAALSLEKAGRHLDAVRIYTTKLNNKWAAATCYENAGLYAQAVDLLIELKDYEKAGDLSLASGQKDAANDLYLRAVVAEKCPVERARLFEEKLQDNPRAIACLDESWRRGTSAVACLEKQFSLLEKSNDPGPLLALSDAFASAEPSILTDRQKATLCIHLRADSQVDLLKESAAQTVLSLASRNLLEKPDSQDSVFLLKSLRALDQTDLLLAKDADRFTNQNKVIALAPTAKRSGHVTPAFTVTIPQAGDWHSLASLDGGCTVAGREGNCLIVATLKNRSCHTSQLATPDYTGGPQTIHHIALSSGGPKARVFHFSKSLKIHFRSLNTSRTNQHNALGQIEQVLALGTISDQKFLALRYAETSGVIALTYNNVGSLITSQTLDLAPPEITDSRWVCAGQKGHICYSTNLFAAWQYPDSTIAGVQLNEPVHKIDFAPATRPVAALLSGGDDISLLIPDKRNRVPEFINLFTREGRSRPTACFTADGDIVVMDGNEGKIFSPDDTLDPICTFSYPAKKGFAKDVTAHGARGWVVLTSTAQLVVFD